MVVKAEWTSLEWPLSSKEINQMQNHIPGVIVKTSDTIKDLKGAGVVIPTSPAFNTSI